MLNATVESDFYVIAADERPQWPAISRQLTKKPEAYLMSAKRLFVAALIIGGLSAACFFGGLLYTMSVVGRL